MKVCLCGNLKYVKMWILLVTSGKPHSTSFFLFSVMTYRRLISTPNPFCLLKISNYCAVQILEKDTEFNKILIKNCVGVTKSKLPSFSKKNLVQL